MRTSIYTGSATIPPFGAWPKLGKVGHGAELPYVFGYPSTALLASP